MKIDKIFFFLLLVFLPTQLGFHFWPDWALVLGRRVDYLSPTLYFTDILLFLILITWRKFTFDKKFIVLTLFILINIFFAQNQPEAIYKWVKVLEFVGFGYYIIKTRPKFSEIIFPLSIGIIYSSIIAIIQFYLQHSIGGLFWFLGERTFTVDTPGIARINFQKELLRPYATFPHPNVLGGYLAAVLPLVIIQLSNNPIIKSSNKKIFYSLVFLLGIIALSLTFSRSAILLGLLAIFYVLLKKIEYKFLLIGLFAAFLFIFSLQFSHFSFNDESIVVREQLNAAAINIWRESPLVGVGLGNFLVELPKFIPERTVYFLQPVHNIYLLILSESGIIGLGIFLKLLWKKHISLPLLILLLLGVVDHYPVTLQQGQLLFTLFLALPLAVQWDS